MLFRLLWERTPISGMALAFSSMPHAHGALDSGGASGDQLTLAWLRVVGVCKI